MIFGNEFHMLAQEGRLAQSTLLSGMEFLRNADYDNTGSYYAAFFQLSIGLERLMKIAFILNHKAKHDLKNPSGKDVRALGHDLVAAYEVCKNLAADRAMNMARWFEAGTPEHDMLSHLSEFAKGARYYNLDTFAERQPFSDPIVKWYAAHKRIADTYISYAKQEKINNLAIAHCDKHGLHGWERSITGEYRLTVDCTFIHELFRQANPYCVWTVINILKPFHSLLSRLSDEVHEVEAPKGIDEYTVPDMQEFFPMCLCDRQTAIRRKRWIGLY